MPYIRDPISLLSRKAGKDYSSTRNLDKMQRINQILYY